MTPELRNGIIAGLCRTLVVYIAARLSIGALDQGHLDQVVAAMTVVVFAGYSAFAKWRASKKAAVKVENLQTVVDTKVAETQVLRAAVADSQAETVVMIDALVQAKAPIPELLPTQKLASIVDPAAVLPNLGKP